MYFVRTVVLPLLLLSLTLATHAETLTTSADNRTSINFNAGTLSGKSGEYVYDADGSASGIEGYKISELQWDLDNVIMAGLGLRHEFNDRFAIGLDYWINAAEGDSSMVDYDWLYVGLDWSDRSQHPDTAVEEVTRLDVSADIVLKQISKYDTDIYALLGYRQDHVEWAARGGTAIYSWFGYRDTYVVFADVPVISYEQTYKTPYIGFGVRSSSMSDGKRVTLDFSARFSDWVEGEDIDIHHLRDLRFEESGDNGGWLELELALGVELSEHLDLNFGVAHSQYTEIKAATTVTDLTTGVTTTYPGAAAGLDYNATMWSLGLSYRI